MVFKHFVKYTSFTGYSVFSLPKVLYNCKIANVTSSVKYCFQVKFYPLLKLNIYYFWVKKICVLFCFYQHHRQKFSINCWIKTFLDFFNQFCFLLLDTKSQLQQNFHFYPAISPFAFLEFSSFYGELILLNLLSNNFLREKHFQWIMLTSTEKLYTFLKLYFNL